MKTRAAFLARVAVFSALAYVLALASFYIPNVSLIFIAVFAAGALYGWRGGLLVGVFGEFLWTFLNPFGMTSLPIVIGQVTGMLLVGLLGALTARTGIFNKSSGFGYFVMAHGGLTAGLLFQVVVNFAGMFLYGFTWEFLAGGLLFSIFTIVSNGVIFPLCYPLLIKLYSRERET